MNTKKNQPKNSNEISENFPRPFDPAALDDIAVEGEKPNNGSFSIPPLPGMDLDSWADGRISIFASLDAAMTSHMMQAVAALSELRRHAEEDARRVGRQLEEERRTIQHEVEMLKQERQHLQNDLSDIRRELDEERARRYALEKENNLMGGNTPSEHANLLRELANLSQQVQELTYQIQNQPQNFATPAEEPVSKPSREKNTNTPAPARSSKKNEPILDMSEMLELDLAAFSDAPTPRLKSNGKGKSSNGTAAQPTPRQKEPAANRRQTQETEQHLERLLAKRSRTVEEENLNELIQNLNEVPFAPVDEPPAPVAPQPPAEEVPQSDKTARRKNDKAALAEIGAKLGLDVQTPPPDDAFRYAHGFTPPPEEGEFSNMALTLEELFNSPGSPLPASFSTLNEESESPFIGEIGLDNAGKWKGTTPSPETEAIPAIPPISRPRSGAETLYPAYVLNPPPSGSAANDKGDASEDIETKITVSNLQGLSLLMMEKVVRGLPGVRHVTVTDFRKGELVMEVVHNKSLVLDKVLPSLPDLKLKLVSRDDGLMFIQER